jgi:hypothetical protein
MPELDNAQGEGFEEGEAHVGAKDAGEGETKDLRLHQQRGLCAMPILDVHQPRSYMWC